MIFLQLNWKASWTLLKQILILCLDNAEKHLDQVVQLHARSALASRLFIKSVEMAEIETTLKIWYTIIKDLIKFQTTCVLSSITIGKVYFPHKIVPRVYFSHRIINVSFYIVKSQTTCSCYMSNHELFRNNSRSQPRACALGCLQLHLKFYVPFFPVLLLVPLLFALPFPHLLAVLIWRRDIALRETRK